VSIRIEAAAGAGRRLTFVCFRLKLPPVTGSCFPPHREQGCGASLFRSLGDDRARIRAVCCFRPLLLPMRPYPTMGRHMFSIGESLVRGWPGLVFASINSPATHTAWPLQQRRPCGAESRPPIGHGRPLSWPWPFPLPVSGDFSASFP